MTGAEHLTDTRRTPIPSARAPTTSSCGPRASGCARARGRSTSSCTRASSSGSPGSRATGRTRSCGRCAGGRRSRARRRADPGAGDRARLAAAAAARAGVAYVPRERRAEALFDVAVGPRELRAADARARHRRGLRAPVGERAPAAAVRRPAADQARPIRATGSRRSRGGNQQKVVIARWLASEPRILLLNDPTRGVDIGAKRDIYDLLAELAAEGIAVVMLSTEVDEHVELMDRVLVFREGELEVELGRASPHAAVLVASFFGQEQAARCLSIRRFLRTRSFAFALLLSARAARREHRRAAELRQPEQLRHEPLLVRAVRARRDGSDARDPERRRRARHLGRPATRGSSTTCSILYLLPHGAWGSAWVAVPIVLALGAAVGLVNGLSRRRAPLPAGHRDALHAVRPPGRQPEDRRRADGRRRRAGRSISRTASGRSRAGSC